MEVSFGKTVKNEKFENILEKSNDINQGENDTNLYKSYPKFDLSSPQVPFEGVISKLTEEVTGNTRVTLDDLYEDLYGTEVDTTLEEKSSIDNLQEAITKDFEQQRETPGYNAATRNEEATKKWQQLQSPQFLPGINNNTNEDNSEDLSGPGYNGIPTLEQVTSEYEEKIQDPHYNVADRSDEIEEWKKLNSRQLPIQEDKSQEEEKSQEEVQEKTLPSEVEQASTQPVSSISANEVIFNCKALEYVDMVFLEMEREQKRVEEIGADLKLRAAAVVSAVMALAAVADVKVPSFFNTILNKISSLTSSISTSMGTQITSFQEMNNDVVRKLSYLEHLLGQVFDEDEYHIEVVGNEDSTTFNELLQEYVRNNQENSNE